MFELVKRKTDIPKVQLKQSFEVSKFCKEYLFKSLTVEENFYIICLNRAQNVTGFYYLSKGSISGTLVDIRILTKVAIDSLSSSVILVHNHPSGNMRPSDEDIKLTKKIVENLKMFDITVLDHVILTEDSYYSLADEGLL